MPTYPKKISYRGFDKLILFGGSFLMAAFLETVKEKNIPVVVFSAPRHLTGAIDDRGETLQERLRALTVPFFESADINTDPRLRNAIGEKSLGIAFGAAWAFKKETASLFAPGYLLDFMGIDLPRYRGGAHYTWQILHENQNGTATLQIILGGAATFHRGPVIKRRTYVLSGARKTPLDYFRQCGKQEAAFLAEFLSEAKRGKTFHLVTLDEKQSSFYPFLSTLHHGFINWGWEGKEIVRFIAAFDRPYRGASTFAGKRRLFLKECTCVQAAERYHPFTAGIVVRKDTDAVYVAARGALLRVATILDEGGGDVRNELPLGSRLYTPSPFLDEAMRYRAEYGAEGLKHS